MRFIRALIREDRLLAATILAMALAMKLFVPAGYMLGSGAGGSMTVTLCSGVDIFVTETVSVPGGEKHQDGQKAAHAMPCAFSALAMAAIGGADASLLALALAFVLLVGLLPVERPRTEPARHLRPPPRAPPAFS